jgi:hypothetical protein
VTKKLYGATFEEKLPQGSDKSAGNAARVAKLFGRDASTPAFAQVVKEAVKQKKETIPEPIEVVKEIVKQQKELMPEPIAIMKEVVKPKKEILPGPIAELTLPKSTYVPAQKSPKKSPTKQRPDISTKPLAVVIPVKDTTRPAFMPITQRLRKESISETVAMMSSQTIISQKLEVKEINDIIKPPTTPRAQVTVLPPLLTSSKYNERQSIPIMLHTEKEKEPCTQCVPLMISDSSLVTSPQQMRKPTRERKDSKISEPSISRNGTETLFDDLMNELGAHASTFSTDSRASSRDRSPKMNNTGIQSRSASSDRTPRLNTGRYHSAKSSIDSVTKLQALPIDANSPIAKSPMSATRNPRRGRSGPKQSISELDDIMLALQAEIKAEPKSRSVSPRPPFTKEVADMQVAIQRAHRSASSTSSKRTQSPSTEAPLKEVPEAEEEIVEIIESRAWEHARRLSEFKLQQELMEKERKRMAEEQLKFQQMEARFKEEEEQQRLFVEDVRKAQEREQQELDERQRAAEEKSRREAEEKKGESAEQARIARVRAESLMQLERDAEEQQQRTEREERKKADEERQRIAAEQERNKRRWEEERARNAAEVARLIAEEEAREKAEMEALSLVRRRDTSLGPGSPIRRKSPDLDDISIYSDDLVESEDEFEQSLEEERRAYELEQEEARQRAQRAEEEKAERQRKRDDQDRRERLRYEAQQAEKLRLEAEEAEEEARCYEVEEEERQRREEEEERLRFELQQDDERRRVEEQKRQKIQFQKEQEERRQYALEEAERLRVEAEQAEERQRVEAEKDKSPFQKQQEYWAERKRMAAQTSQPNSPAATIPTQRSPTQARSPPRSPAVDQQRLRAEAEAQAAVAEERRIQEIAAKMQAEDEAAEAEATKKEELRKAEEKIRAAFAGMALERGEAPPMVPVKEIPARAIGKGGPLPGLGRSATFQSDGPAVPMKETSPRIMGKMKPPVPIRRAGTVAGGEAPANLQALAGGTRSNTAPISSNTSALGVPAVTRGNTVAGRPGGLPSGPRAGRGGLPSGPRPRRI